MKKNIAARLGVLALVLTLVTSSLVSGTYSKYTSQVTGNDTARVAKFAFNVKDGTAADTLSTATQTHVFNIFSYSATDSGVYTSAVGLDGKKLVAPGTTGKLALEVDNQSEVAVTAAFTLTEANTSKIPIYYTYSGGTAPTQRYSDALVTKTYTPGGSGDTGIYKPLSDLASAMAASLPATDGTAANQTSKTYTLNWVWSFDQATTSATQSDSDDTTLGTMATLPTVNLSVATTVTQSDT